MNEDAIKQIITITPEGMEWELIVDVSAKLEGGLGDWPSHIQEPILEELQKTVSRAHEDGELGSHIRTVEVLNSYCDYDYDEHVYFLHVVAAARAMVRDNATILKNGKVVH